MIFKFVKIDHAEAWKMLGETFRFLPRA